MFYEAFPNIFMRVLEVQTICLCPVSTVSVSLFSKFINLFLYLDLRERK
jgi:hypothetical protein